MPNPSVQQEVQRTTVQNNGEPNWVPPNCSGSAQLRSGLLRLKQQQLRSMLEIAEGNFRETHIAVPIPSNSVLFWRLPFPVTAASSSLWTKHRDQVWHG